jgi:hypothetical protein
MNIDYKFGGLGNISQSLFLDEYRNCISTIPTKSELCVLIVLSQRFTISPKV